MRAELKEGSFISSTHGEKLWTYAWEVPSPKGLIFLQHGLHSTVYHEFFAPPTDGSGAGQYSGSVIELLCNAGFSVLAHDHRGHGKSDGLRAFFRLPECVADSLQYVNSVLEERESAHPPVFLCGVSMGGTISLLMERARPSFFRGAVLISPAVKEPDNSFGALGAVLAMASAAIANAMPRSPVLLLPPPPIKELADYWTADPDVYHGKLRARPGRDMIVAYRTLEQQKEKITMPMAVFYGSEDSLVSADGIQEFFDAVGSTDKLVKVYDGMWHVLFIEEGGERICQDAVTWLLDHTSLE